MPVGGVALDVLDGAEAFANREREILGGDIVLEIDEGRLPRRVRVERCTAPTIAARRRFESPRRRMRAHGACGSRPLAQPLRPARSRRRERRCRPKTPRQAPAERSRSAEAPGHVGFAVSRPSAACRATARTDGRSASSRRTSGRRSQAIVSARRRSRSRRAARARPRDTRRLPRVAPITVVPVRTAMPGRERGSAQRPSGKRPHVGDSGDLDAVRARDPAPRR